MNNNFCPLINDYCKSNCVFLEQQASASGYGLVKQCSLAGAIKNSIDRPNAEVLIQLKNLLSKL
ncbi:MAG: hypothetical protein U0L66_01960 [Acutalibacteraceae bacterium]|nr:hypothetical protein [Acutalibacteraceae bacterium]